MADKNGASIVPGLKNAIRPIKHIGVLGRVVFQVDNNKINAACAEEFVMIVVVGAVMAPVVIVSTEMPLAKELIIEKSAAGDITHRALIVITYGDAIRNSVL